MKDDPARKGVVKEFRENQRFMRDHDLPADFLFYDDQTVWPPGDGEGMLCPIHIGARGNLSKAEAKLGAKMWREATERYPKACFMLALLGYNDDPREIWEFADARRYVRWWARFAGMDNIETAERFVGVSSTIGQALGVRANGLGFLAACGVFGEELRQAALRGQMPTIAQ